MYVLVLTARNVQHQDEQNLWAGMAVAGLAAAEFKMTYMAIVSLLFPV